MLKIFKQAAKITNDNIILTIPLILSVWIINLYSVFSKHTVNNSIEFIIATVTVLFMVGAFFAGWFYMIKKAIELSKQVFVLDLDRVKATMNLFKVIPEGIGKYFTAFVGMYIILFFIQIGISIFVVFLGTKLIGTLDAASIEQLSNIATDTSVNSDLAVAAFADSLTPEQVIFFGKWNLLFIIATSLTAYFLMLWVPEIIYKTKNPIIALYNSLIKLFKNFIKTIKLFLFLFVIGFLLLFTNTFAILNPFTYFLMSVVLFYFITYTLVAIFLFYSKNYDEKQ